MKKILFFTVLIFLLFAKILLPVSEIGKGSGTIWAWGSNIWGELGNGTNVDSNIPVKLLDLSNVIAISAGGHSLALKNDGTVWAWGGNTCGELGNGTNEKSNVPVQVSNLTNVIAISAGFEHSLALKEDGTVWAWGANRSGQLGNGRWDDSNIPVQVLNLTNVIAIAAGAVHSLALKNDGTVWAWGLNEFGELGDGTNNYMSNVPVQTLNLTNVIAISAGFDHSIALKKDGTVWAWGWNAYGKLGNGSSYYMSNIPVQVSNLTNVIAISAGRDHCLAIRDDGTVWAWGYNGDGQLGNGTIDDSNIPIQVSKLTNVVEISGGEWHSLALKQDGTVWAWGYNYYGQLGNGTNIGSYFPVQVSNLTNVAAISAGVSHSLAIVLGSNDFIIPAGAHSKGAYGSYWKTNLSICNFTNSSQNINIALQKAGQDNTNPENFSLEIWKNFCISFDDLFYEKFNYEGAGAIKVSASTEKLKINSRTYNDAESGTYGQFIPGIYKEKLLKKGEIGYLTFLQKNENFRTNIGFSSLSENQIVINLKLYNSNGEKIAEKELNLEPFGYRQENDIFGQFGINNISNGYGTASSNSEGAYFTSYASVIDNKSNDPIFIPAEK